jgi:RNA polymerase sigma-70 factor (ECF subfamily)
MSDFSPESSFLELLKRRDDAAWQRLVVDESPMIYQLACGLVGPSDAADVAQEVFQAAWKHIAQFNGAAKIRTWLYRIGLNKCHLTRRKRKQRSDAMKGFIAVKQAECSPPGTLSQLGDRELVREALDRLDDKSRLILALRHFRGLSYAEIGEVFGWSSKATVAKHVRQATEQLKELLSRLSGGGC